MDLRDTESQRALRTEIRTWLRDNVPSEPLPSMDTVEGFAAHRDWERTLAADGWSVVAWPEEYGGRDLDLLEWLIFEEEYHRAGAPGRVNQNGVFMMGPTLLEHGSHEQKERLLPPMASGDAIWCQGWSEPGAGSDLASLRSPAVKAEGGYVVSGQKVWVSRGVWADWMFGLFRTGPVEDRHRALTFLVLPLDQAGVDVRPIRQLDGTTGFAEVFLDEVFVPERDVISEENGGWHIAMATAGFERGLLLRSPGRFIAAAHRLRDLHREQQEVHPALSRRVLDSWIDARAYDLYVKWTVGRIAAGAEIGPESSLTKLFWSELDLDLHAVAMELLGERATLLPEGSEPAWLDGYLFALAGPIYAGTNQIQRNIVAERILGLPRSS